MKPEINTAPKAQEVPFTGMDMANRESVSVTVKVEKDGLRLMKPFQLKKNAFPLG